MSKRAITGIAVGALAGLLFGCGEGGSSASSAAAPTATVQTAAWILEAEPEGAVGVGQVKANAAEGDQIVVRGRIGGRVEPMTEGSPTFVVTDLSLPYCGEKEADGCATPWDYCCEPRESLQANTATVQVVGENGQPVTGDLRAAGLEELDEVVLVGTVGPRPDPAVLIIRATGVYDAGHE